MPPSIVVRDSTTHGADVASPASGCGARFAARPPTCPGASRSSPPARGRSATIRGLVLVLASTASLAVAAFHTAFAAYLLGADHLADRPLLGGLGSYAEEVDSGAAPVAASIILALGVVILVAGLVRPVAPLAANIATMTIAVWSVLWFWLGAAPLGIVAVAAAITDMALRAPALQPRT